MLFMVVEHFKNYDALPVYRRFRDRGRLAPEGVQYCQGPTALIARDACGQTLPTLRSSTSILVTNAR